jgi:hypothetical protein
LLDRLLADYYSDSIEGSEKATAKEATLARCAAGTLTFYEIHSDRKFVVRGEIIEVKGISRDKPKLVTDNDAEPLTRVRRMWTMKDRNWLLIGQTIEPVEEDSKE